MSEQKKIKERRLTTRLEDLASSQPFGWGATGPQARPNLHGLLRYPAMMVPCMQGDIIDTVLRYTGNDCRIIDPFVGSGTILTESNLRGLDFVGVDINPLAVLVCEAKASIAMGCNVEASAFTVLNLIKKDPSETIDVDFTNREKWFGDATSAKFSKIRRAIQKVEDEGARKVLWTIFAETMRLCSNSRTSTYKLHIRKINDFVPAEKVEEAFISNMKATLARIREFAPLLSENARSSDIDIVCSDIRKAQIQETRRRHQIVITSPPYGDNQTTIPYGQFSYLALKWIPRSDLPSGFDDRHLENTHALDSASLGGTNRDTKQKAEFMRSISPTFDQYMTAMQSINSPAIPKVASFAFDYYEALSAIKKNCTTPSHWVMTTGNRTAGGQRVPLDMIGGEIIVELGGQKLTSIQRELPTKRMPNRNSMGEMITSETTLIAEFA